MHLLAVLAATAAVAGNPADRLAHLPIDPLRYDHAHRCAKGPQSGTKALERWLSENAQGESWGIMRCQRFAGRDVYSLHAEGRAIDWRLDDRDPRQRREAERLIRLLLAPDRRGNQAALARRMGVQEIIWACRSWYAGAPGLRDYSACRRPGIDRTTAHRDHVHIGLNWPGGRGQTSFWRSSLARS